MAVTAGSPRLAYAVERAASAGRGCGGAGHRSDPPTGARPAETAGLVLTGGGQPQRTVLAAGQRDVLETLTDILGEPGTAVEAGEIAGVSRVVGGLVATRDICLVVINDEKLVDEADALAGHVGERVDR